MFRLDCSRQMLYSVRFIKGIEGLDISIAEINYSRDADSIFNSNITA